MASGGVSFECRLSRGTGGNSGIAGDGFWQLRMGQLTVQEALEAQYSHHWPPCDASLSRSWPITYAKSHLWAREIDKRIKNSAHPAGEITRGIMAMSRSSSRISARVPSPASNGDIQARQPQVLLQSSQIKRRRVATLKSPCCHRFNAASGRWPTRE